MNNRKSMLHVALLMTLGIPVFSCSLIGELPAFQDGCYLGYAKAWVDGNENGIWDEEEKPLQGVEFELLDEERSRNYLHESISGESGSHFISTFPDTCKSLALKEMVLRASPPTGYRTTTPGEVVLQKEQILDADLHDYLFGFVSDNP